MDYRDIIDHCTWCGVPIDGDDEYRETGCGLWICEKCCREVEESNNGEEEE